jgi:hypothetical protein
LATARWLSTLAGAGYIVTLLLPGDTSIFTEYGGVMIPSVIASFFFLRSGYYFKLINEDAPTAAVPQSITIIDFITYLAALASNPAQIDRVLDKLRVITATFSTGDRRPQLAPEQDNTLRQVYADIEKYLVEKEPIRQFTTEQLRQKITKNFGITNNQLLQLIDVSQPMAGSAAQASTPTAPPNPLAGNLQTS